MREFEYKKSLGQNFLKDKNIIKKISDSINPSKKDLIIEIGPGAGALTKELKNKECDIICFEIDERLKEKLNTLENDRLRIIYNDFLKVNLTEYIDKKYEKLFFVGNLPYYITTAIIKKIMQQSNPEEITIMVQKEVGQRFVATPNTKEYNSLSIYLQYNFNIKKICDVNKNCFEPVPKVDSVVVKFTKKEKDYVRNEEAFYKLIRDSFNQKRKNLRNNLKSYNLEKIEEVLKKYNKDLTYRAEQLTINEFINISNNL